MAFVVCIRSDADRLARPPARPLFDSSACPSSLPCVAPSFSPRSRWLAGWLAGWLTLWNIVPCLPAATPKKSHLYELHAVRSNLQNRGRRNRARPDQDLQAYGSEDFLISTIRGLDLRVSWIRGHGEPRNLSSCRGSERRRRMLMKIHIDVWFQRTIEKVARI